MGGMAPSAIKGKVGRGGEKEETLRLEVVMNLICILIPVLLVQQVVEYFRHDVELPIGPTKGSSAAADDKPEDKKEKPFGLKLTIGSDGSFLIVKAKVLVAGEGGLVVSGPGLVLPPLASGAPNFSQLQRLLSKEKNGRMGGRPAEAFVDPDQITISAPVDTKFQALMETLDYVRYAPFEPGKDMTEAKQMFTMISLSPGSVSAG
jgi:hypothetical protein